MKKLTLAALAVGAVFANTSAFAAPTSCLTGYRDLSYFTGLGSTGCLQGDKIWSDFTFSGNLGSGTQARFGFDSVGGKDFHKFQIAFDPTFLRGAGEGTYGYKIIVDPAETNRYFSNIQLGVDINAAQVNAKYLGIDNNGHHYTITNPGGTGGTFNQPTSSLDDKEITVTQTVTADATGQLNSITHTYTQERINDIPEIDALAGTGALTLLGGALALAGERRRRSTKA